MRGTVHGNALYFIRSVCDSEFERSPDFDEEFLEHCEAMFGGEVEAAIQMLVDLFLVDHGKNYHAWQKLIADAEATGEIADYYERGS